QFVSGHVADFKVPRQILIVAELPKGPSGKVQRIGLAAKLGLGNGVATARSYVAPRTPLEKKLSRLWAEILQIKQVGIHHDFFALGGDSLTVTRVIAQIHDVLDVDVKISRFFEAPTVAEMAEHLEQLIRTGQARPPSQAIRHVPRQGR